MKLGKIDKIDPGNLQWLEEGLLEIKLGKQGQGSLRTVKHSITLLSRKYFGSGEEKMWDEGVLWPGQEQNSTECGSIMFDF